MIAYLLFLLIVFHIWIDKELLYNLCKNLMQFIKPYIINYHHYATSNI